MRRLTISLLTAALFGCSFGSNDGLVARAGEHDLTVEELASMLASGNKVLLRRHMVEMWAHRWVEFSLFAQAAAKGDSLLDPETVRRARWPDEYGELIDLLRTRLVEERVLVNDATLDSAYQDPERHVLYHILVRTPPDISPPDRDAARHRADRIRSRLTAGEAWEDLNELNEDPVAKAQGGGLGLAGREDFVQAFSDAAFALAPGAISDVVETRFGFHVIWRPSLTDAREEIAEAVRLEIEERMLAEYQEEILVDHRVELRDNAAGVMREIARAPFLAFQDQELLGTYDGERFTTLDFVHWLQALPPYIHQQTAGMSDEQLEFLAEDLMLQEVQVRTARELGLAVSDSILGGMYQELAYDVHAIRRRLAIDSALAAASTDEARLAAMNAVVNAFILDVAVNMTDAVVVPAFLASKLRSEQRWRVSSQGVDQALALAEELRAARVGTPTPAQVPVPAPPSEEPR
jgi:hypothetical protein